MGNAGSKFETLRIIRNVDVLCGYELTNHHFGRRVEVNLLERAADNCDRQKYFIVTFFPPNIFLENLIGKVGGNAGSSSRNYTIRVFPIRATLHHIPAGQQRSISSSMELKRSYGDKWEHHVRAIRPGEGFNLSKLKGELQGVGLPLFPGLPSHLIHQPVDIDGLRNNRAISNTQILCNVDRGGEAGKRKGSFKFHSLIHRGKIGF